MFLSEIILIFGKKLKVNDQLVAYATRFLAVRLKNMCGRTTAP